MSLTTTAPSAKRKGLNRATTVLATAALALTGVMSAGAIAIPAQTAEAAATTPNVKALAGDLSKQKLTWETCDFGTPDLNTRFNDPNVKCATVKVPRDWHNPGNGKTWDIRISQAKNIDVKNARYKGTIFVNPGGPGGEGLPWGSAMQQRTPDLNPYYNYIGFDPRGVGQSSHASCTWQYATDDPDQWASAKACASNEDVKTISTEQTTYDMDFIRVLLGAPKLSYIGYSYGTWLGAWYEKVFGAKYGDKFVLDSSTNVTDATLQGTWDMQGIARDRQFQYHLMDWIARHDADYKLGTDPAAIYRTYLRESGKMDPNLLNFVWAILGGAQGFPKNAKYPDSATTVKFIIENAADNPPEAGAKGANPAARAAALIAKIKPSSKGLDSAELTQALTQAKALAKLPTVEQQTKSKLNSFEARTLQNATTADEGTSEGEASDPFDFIRCNDGQWTQGVNYWTAWNAKMKKKAPLTAQFGMFDLPPVCAFWRTNTTMPVANATFPKTIVIQGEMDSQTAWEGGYISGTQLPNTSFIAIDNEGSHGHFPYGTEAVDRPVFDYFLTGKQPAAIKVTQALPLPNDTQTFETFKKLNKSAKHVGTIVTDPFQVAGPGAKMTAVAKANQANDAALAKSDEQAALERVIAQTYGERGVKVLRQNTK